MAIKLVMPSNHLILCRPLLPHLWSFPASGSFPVSQFFASGGKIWEFQLHQQSFQWIFRLIFFRMDWFDLLAVQVTLKSLLQHHSSKPPILRYSAFFMVQHSHQYMSTGKTVALTRQTFVGKAMSLLFNMLSRSVIAFLRRSKHLLILWLHSPSTGILVTPKIKCHCFHCFPINLTWSDGTRYHDLSFLNVEF